MKLKDAEREVAKLEGRRDGLQAKLATAQAGEVTLQAAKRELERRCYGAEDGTTEADIAEVDRAIAKSAGQQRGIKDELDLASLQLADAREALRAAQRKARAQRFRELGPLIAKLEAELRPLRVEQASILVEDENSASLEQVARNQDLAELEALGLAEREDFPGGRIIRKVTSERE